MRRLIPLAISCLALAVSPVARADGGAMSGAKQPSTLAALLGHLRLRRGLDDQNLLAKPANLAVTWPGTGPATWAVDGALSATGCAVCAGAGVQLELGGGVEYHRDTELSAPKNLFAAGLTAELYLGHLSDVVSHDLKASLEYHRDVVADTGSAVAYLDYVPLGPLAIGRVWPSPRSGVFSAFALEWAPTFSLEWGDTFAGADADAGGRGQVLRVRLQGELRVYLAPRALREQVFLQASVALRDTVASSQLTERAGHRSHLLTAGLTAYVDPGHHAALSLEYREGVDPRAGQGQDRYLRLTLSLKL